MPRKTRASLSTKPWTGPDVVFARLGVAPPPAPATGERNRCGDEPRDCRHLEREAPSTSTVSTTKASGARCDVTGLLEVHPEQSAPGRVVRRRHKGR